MNKGTVYIETFGCQMNVADSERAVADVLSAGFEITESEDRANIILLNTCSIRERAEQKLFNRLGELRKHENLTPLIGVMGCVAQLEGKALFDRATNIDLIIGTRAIDRLAVLVARAQNGEKRVVDIGERQKNEIPSSDQVVRRSQSIAFVPIIEGCNKFCTYCVVPYSRGRERSRPPLDIIREVRQLFNSGYQEVQLIGQNVNSYRPTTDEGLKNFSGLTDFSRLLRAVASTHIPRIKFTTSFPRDFHPDIVQAMDENDNLCNWIHLPVQSGSNRVLKAMRRGYSRADYLKRVDVIKNAKRNYALTSDIIVGFPGETAEDFAETIELLKECQYHSLYIFKYSRRPHTRAEKLEDNVTEAEKRARFKMVEETQREIQNKIFSDYVNTEQQVLVEGKSARSKTDLTGHTTCNKVINFRGAGDCVGKVVSVRVTSTKSHSLYGMLDQECQRNSISDM